MRYRVRRIAAAPLVRAAAFAGALVALAPGAVCALALVWAAQLAHTTLDSWRAVRLPFPPPLNVGIDFVALLRLESLFAAVRAWDSAAALVLAATIALFALGGALVGALAGLAAALLLNVSAGAGGFVVDLDPVDPPDPPPAGPSTPVQRPTSAGHDAAGRPRR